LTLSACGPSEPEPEWDYATYSGQEVAAFAPLPGADLNTWRASIDSLGLGGWGRKEEAEAQWARGNYAPREDERVEDERLLWALEEDLDSSDGLLIFTAQAVTDESGALLFVYCETAYYDRESDGTITPAVWEALEACAAGAANDAVDAAGFEDWVAGVRSAFDSPPEDPFRTDRVERLHSGSMEAFLTDDGRTMAVSVAAAIDPEGTS
jgi:hypothetical protein